MKAQSLNPFSFKGLEWKERTGAFTKRTIRACSPDD
jgi:hypothetical protein